MDFLNDVQVLDYWLTIRALRYYNQVYRFDITRGKFGGSWENTVALFCGSFMSNYNNTFWFIINP